MKVTRRFIPPGIACALLAAQGGLKSVLAGARPGEIIEVSSIRAEKQGDGTPLIFIPGLAGGPWVWAGMTWRFSPRSTVYCLTLPGFDGRPGVAAPVIDKAVADITLFIEQSRLERPVLVGHSLGGFIALRVAIERPALIGAIVTVDGFPVFPPLADADAAGRRAAAEQRADEFAKVRNQAELLTLMSDFMAERMNDPLEAAKAAAEAARSDPAAIAHYLREMLSADLRPDLHKLTAPWLALAADNSYKKGLSGAAIQDFYARLLANAPRAAILLIRRSAGRRRRRDRGFSRRPEALGVMTVGPRAGGVETKPCGRCVLRATTSGKRPASGRETPSARCEV